MVPSSALLGEALAAKRPKHGIFATINGSKVKATNAGGDDDPEQRPLTPTRSRRSLA